MVHVHAHSNIPTLAITKWVGKVTVIELSSCISLLSHPHHFLDHFVPLHQFRMGMYSTAHFMFVLFLAK